MSDEDTSTTTGTDEASEETTEEASQQTDESQEDSDKESAWDPERAKTKIRKVNSENKALRERASAAEKKAAGADEVTQERDNLSRTNMQLDVGYDLGLPKSLALRLQGNTKEEMVADAESLVELVSPSKSPATRKPTEALRAGLNSDQEPEETDLNKLGDRMFRS